MIYCKIYINVLIFLCLYTLCSTMLLKIANQHTDYSKQVLISMSMNANEKIVGGSPDADASYADADLDAT